MCWRCFAFCRDSCVSHAGDTIAAAAGGSFATPAARAAFKGFASVMGAFLRRAKRAAARAPCSATCPSSNTCRRTSPSGYRSESEPRSSRSSLSKRTTTFSNIISYIFYCCCSIKCFPPFPLINLGSGQRSMHEAGTAHSSSSSNSQASRATHINTFPATGPQA
jgi:hypothetical protein